MVSQRINESELEFKLRNAKVSREYRQTNLERCKETERLSHQKNKEEDNRRCHVYYLENKEEIIKRVSRTSARVRRGYRKRILDLLGRKCANSNCPIPLERMDEYALQIDHKNNNGHEEREKYGSDSKQYYEHILANIQNYQILCVYCNWIKRKELKVGG